MSSRDQLLYHLEMEMTCTTVFLRHLSLRPPEAKKQDTLVPLSFRGDSITKHNHIFKQNTFEIDCENKEPNNNVVDQFFLNPQFLLVNSGHFLVLIQNVI